MTIRLATCGPFLATVLLSLAGCGSFPSGSPDDGQVVSGVYSNSFFGFSMDLPNGWPVAPGNTMTTIQQNEHQAIAAKTRDLNFQPKLRAPRQDSHQLLLVSEKPWGTPAESNPSLIIAAEKALRRTGITTGQDYLVQVSRLLANSPLPYQPLGALAETRLGDRTFHRLDFTARLANKLSRQSYLATVDRGYSLVFIISGGENDFNSLEAALKTIRFH
jgi:hypothetical protein